MKIHQPNFIEFVEPHISGLYNMALRMSGNNNDASIMVQNTFRKAFESSDNFKQINNFKVWIFQILTTAILATNNDSDFEIDKQEISDELEEFYLFKKLDEKNSLQDTAKNDILENFFEKDVKSVLEKLPYQFRLLVLLCDVEGFSYTEISTIIDTSLKTVISRLYHGRKLLQRNLWNSVEKRSYFTIRC